MIFLGILLLLIYTNKITTDDDGWCVSYTVIGLCELSLELTFIAALIQA